MPSKTREARVDQKVSLESELSQRLADLTEKGRKSDKLTRDPKVRKLRAQLRKTTNRLEVIAAKEKKIEEMAKAKAEKASLPIKEKAKKQKGTSEEAEMSKRQQKKREKIDKKQSKDDAEATE